MTVTAESVKSKLEAATGYNQVKIKVDVKPSLADHKPMTDITRQEFDAKFEAREARLDARIDAVTNKMDASISAITNKMDLFLVRSEAAEKLSIARHDNSEKILQQMLTHVAAAADRTTGLKSTLWVTSLTTILAVFALALAAYFGTQQSNIGISQITISAFESGKGSVSTPTALAPAPAPVQKK
ncbi:hypothetical protein [Glaciimonas immobilis]|uniref:Ribosome-associated translation inhibitor RaiA n=1 Tax=Glaciimonas immobilis TaxID=728004 RepID=A0A840RSQ8_9BURK|nr:hypothetical protein [Glaciimonas immobilis]KAF3997480.1 hypothetical protein HAV38_12430 [Glaciimonas immobilis]MBB5200845.1 ribosome-associated translation inhibitor RaiA [Glaciimonas immobilis]